MDLEKDREYTSRKEGNAKRKNSSGISREYFPIRRNGRFETLAEANLSNNFLFVKVMSDEVILKKFLEMVLKVKIRELKMIQYEKAVIPDIMAKSIRLDIYADDGKNEGIGTLYNVEMQQRNDYNIGKRSRYYQSAMDMNALKPGEDYEFLSKSYIIFICLFDPFGKGLQRYTFIKKCAEDDSIDLEDDAATLILTDNPGEPEIEKFFRYLKNSTYEEAERSGSEFVKLLNEKVYSVRSDKKTEAEYMSFERYYRDQYNFGVMDGRIEGKIQGSQEKERFIASRLKEKGMANEELAELLGVTSEELKTILDPEHKEID